MFWYIFVSKTGHCNYDYEKNGGFYYFKKKLEEHNIDIIKLFEICESKNFAYIRKNINRIVKEITMDSNTMKKRYFINKEIEKIEFTDKEIVKRYNHRKIRKSGIKTKIKNIDIEHFIFVLLVYIIINNETDYFKYDNDNKQYVFNVPFKYIREKLSNYFHTTYNTTEHIHKSILNIKKKGILDINSIKPGRDRFLTCTIPVEKFNKLYNSFIIDIETNFIRLIGYNDNTYDKYEPYHIKDKISNYIYRTLINFTITFLLSDKDKKIELFITLLNILNNLTTTTLLDNKAFTQFVNTNYKISYSKTKRSDRLIFITPQQHNTTLKSIYLNTLNNDKNYGLIYSLLSNRHNIRKKIIKSLTYSIILTTINTFEKNNQ